MACEQFESKQAKVKRRHLAETDELSGRRLHYIAYTLPTSHPALAKAIKMPIVSMTTTILKFLRKLGAFQQRARFETIEITRHGRRTFVLMSAEQYDWMQATGRRMFRTSDAAAVVIDAVKRATMHPEHAALDELLK